MINDYISIGSGKVIDLGIMVDLILEDSSNQGDIITDVITIISDYFNVNKIEMGQDLTLGSLRAAIMRADGVLNLVNLKVLNKVGGQYSQSVTSQPYINVGDREIGLIDDTVFTQPSEILQIRFPEKDISIRVKKLNKPTFT
tara:strand:- start:83 stop:508 length:426 start_codon:yes stop_codon:yes gene_type:complete